MDYIVLDNIEKSYGKNKVLKKTNLSIKEGDLVTLLGPSGCGKSTLLRCLAGLESLSSGNIYLDSKDITKLPAGQRNIGMVFQEYSLFPSMTVYNNIAYGLKRNKVSKKEIDKKIKNILNIVELRGKENKYPSQLSGGEKQRVALARSIITEPKVLLLDEPLSAIDAKLRKSLQDKIREINKKFNITTIFVTHDQEEAMRISDIVYIMNNGKIEQSGSPLEVYKNPESLFVAEFIGNHNIFKKQDYKRILKKDMKQDYAILRPEKIKIGNINLDYRIKGKLLDYIVLGNTIRYIFDIGNRVIKVDTLNSQGEVIDIDENVLLNFNENDLIYLGGKNEKK